MTRDIELERDEGRETEAPDITSLAVVNQSEISNQIATAKRYPRSIKGFRNEALQLATLDERTAEECIYALPRDGKVIEGPSARFAEIVNYSWGNTRAGARVVGDDGEFVTSQGLFYDLEKNTAISYEVQRRITNKSGQRFSADMVGVTSNAASSIALRNAILKGIPKAFWKPIYDAARGVVAGDFKTLANRRAEAIAQFQRFGVTPEMIFATLGVKGAEDITIEHLVTMKGILTAIKEGDTSPEQAFGATATQDNRLADRSASRLAQAMEKAKGGASPKSEPDPQPAATESGSTSAEPPVASSADPIEEARKAQEKLDQHRGEEPHTMRRAAHKGQAVEGLNAKQMGFKE